MQVVGLYKEDSEYQVACLNKHKNGIAIEFLDKRGELLPFSKETMIATGIEGQDLLIRHLKSPLKNRRALQKTLPFQLEALIPYSLDEVLVKPIYIREEEETQGTFFTVSKECFEKYLNQSQEEGIDPEWVSVIPMALFRFGGFVSPEVKTLVIFHVGHKSTQLVSICSGMVQSHLTIHIGEKDFQCACDQDNFHDLSSVDEKKSPYLFELLTRFNREVDRAFCFLSHREEPVGCVLFCGALADQIEGVLGKAFPITPVEIKSRCGFDAETMRPYAISIGLAIDAIIDDEKSVQLRQGEYISKPCLKKIKKGVVKGGILAAMLCVLTAFCSYAFFEKKQHHISNQIEKLAAEYEEEIPALNAVKKAKGAQEKINALNRILRLPKNRDGYFAPPPLVSDFLSFIAIHPKLEGIELVRIDYELKSYPTLDHPQKGYSPKVKIVFTTDEAKKAREFHDAIVEEDEVIRTSGDIEWNRKGNEYEIAFFLQV